MAFGSFFWFGIMLVTSAQVNKEVSTRQTSVQALSIKYQMLTEPRALSKASVNPSKCQLLLATRNNNDIGNQIQ